MEIFNRSNQCDRTVLRKPAPFIATTTVCRADYDRRGYDQLIMLLWSQFVPLVVFLVFGKQRETALKNLDVWMTKNARYINSAFAGGLGLFLVLRI